MTLRRRLLAAAAASLVLVTTACSSSTPAASSSSLSSTAAATSAATSAEAATSAGSSAASTAESSAASSAASSAESSVESSGATAGSSAAGSSAADDPSLLQGKVVWYADLIDANPLVKAIAQALNDKITANGGTMVRSFAVNNTTGQLDLGVQAEAMTRAVASKPAAIAYFVIDPKSLKPQVTRARAAGIPVYAAFGKPDGFDVDAYITLDDEKQGYLAAKYLADKLPKGAKVAVISGPPTANVNAEVVGALKALTEAGVTMVGDVEQQRNLTDNAAGGQTIMQGILQSHPDVQGVFAYNDDSALGAIAAAKAASKTVLFSSRNGSSDGVGAVKNGSLLATCDIDPIALGHELGQAIVDKLAGKPGPAAGDQLPPPDASNCLITKDNADSWKPYDQRIKYQDIKTG